MLGVDEGAVHVAQQGGGAGERRHAGLAVPGEWLFLGWSALGVAVSGARGGGVVAGDTVRGARSPVRQSAAVRTSGLACAELRTVKTTEPGR
ncbi:hypothetical protein GCM10027028_50140 [Streptomyces sundarbansensis]